MNETKAELVDQSQDPAGQLDAAAVAGAQVSEPDVSDPAKLIRLGTMLQAVLTELRETDTDKAGLRRLVQIHTETLEEVQKILSEDLRDELMEFNKASCCEEPTEAEMRVAHAQLVGWMQGLLRGMQATATAQAQMAQQQMMMMQMQAQAQAQGARAPARGLPSARPDDGDNVAAGYL